MLRMGLDRVHLRRSGATFWQLLGTAGDGFGLGDADLHRWALLTCWPDGRAAAGADALRTVRAWDEAADERARLRLRPVGTRGRWAGQAPFGPDTDAPPPGSLTGPVAALTRARVRGTSARRFRTDVPAVAQELAASDGLRFAMGVGERPTGTAGHLLALGRRREPARLRAPVVRARRGGPAQPPGAVVRRGAVRAVRRRRRARHPRRRARSLRVPGPGGRLAVGWS